MSWHDSISRTDAQRKGRTAEPSPNTSSSASARRAAISLWPELREVDRTVGGILQGMGQAAVAQIGLNHARVGALGSERKAARVTQHLRRRRERQTSPYAAAAQQEPDGLAAQGLPALTHKEGVGLRLPLGSFPEPGLDRLAFIRAERLRRRVPMLQSPDVEPMVPQIHLRQREPAGFRDTEAMPEHQQQQAPVPRRVAMARRTGQ